MKQMIATITNDALVAAHINSIARTMGSTLKGVATAMLIEEAKRQMRDGVCHFVYLKKDGSVREERLADFANSGIPSVHWTRPSSTILLSVLANLLRAGAAATTMMRSKEAVAASVGLT